jgi:hypothetical protein
MVRHSERGKFRPEGRSGNRTRAGLRPERRSSRPDPGRAQTREGEATDRTPGKAQIRGGWSRGSRTQSGRRWCGKPSRGWLGPGRAWCGRSSAGMAEASIPSRRPSSGDLRDIREGPSAVAVGPRPGRSVHPIDRSFHVKHRPRRPDSGLACRPPARSGSWTSRLRCEG